MKHQFRHQQFQADAANAVCDVFSGQPFHNERDFANELEAHKQEVEIYVKLPRGFYIGTPVGKYNPDWTIAFYEGKIRPLIKC